MKIFAYNDGGREAAGYKGHTGDCAARSIAIALGIDYKAAYNLVNSFGAVEHKSKRRHSKSNARTGVFGPTMRRIMESLGWIWTPTMLIGSGCKVHVKADELPMGNIILALSKHYVAMIDGVLQDTYDSSRDGTRCVYGYWRKP